MTASGFVVLPRSRFFLLERRTKTEHRHLVARKRWDMVRFIEGLVQGMGWGMAASVFVGVVTIAPELLR
jgi:hypothetical protein